MIEKRQNIQKEGAATDSRFVEGILEASYFKMSASERQAILLDAIKEQATRLQLARQSLTALAQEARRQGVSFASIGQATGRSAQAIQQWLKRQNSASERNGHA